MPPSPEISYRCGKVGTVEVLGQVDVEQSGTSQRHVSITGEVHVDLESIGIGCKQQRQTGEGVDIIIYGITYKPRRSAITTFLKSPQVNSSIPKRMLS